MSEQAWTYHGGGVLSKPRKDGRRVYFIKYRRDGRPVFERVGLDEEKARARRTAQKDNAEDPKWIPPPVKRKEAREAIKAERAAKAVEKPAHTFADLLKVYRDECMKAKRRADWQEWMLKLVEPEFGTLALDALTPERIEAWRDTLASEVLSEKEGKKKFRSASTVRKYVYFLSGIYADTMRTAAGRKLVTDNPCRLVTLPPEPKGLRKALTTEQAADVLTAARNDAAIYRWAALVLHTGLRVEEARDLEWENVGLEWDGDAVTAARFAVHETKTGRPRYVEAGKQLLPDLAAWNKSDRPKSEAPRAEAGEATGPMIGEAFSAFPYDRWRTVFAAAKVPWGTERGQFTPRNLRTTFCMLAFQNGARPEELVQQTGHSMETLFAYYAEASRDQRRRAVDALPDLKRAGLRVVG